MADKVVMMRKTTTGYSHRVVYSFVRRGGILDGLTLTASFRVCSYADAIRAEESLAKTLDLVSFRIEDLV